MKKAASFALVLGFLLFAVLALYEGVGDVAHAFARIGVLGAILIAGLRLLQTLGATFAWRFLLPKPRPGPWLLFQVRLVRESVNSLLPVASVGGDILGTRLLIRRGIDGGISAASVIFDLLTQTATQAIFTAVGVVLLVTAGGAADPTLAATISAAFMIPMIAGAWIAPRLLSMPWIDRLAEKVEAQTGWPSTVGLPSLRAGLDAILRNRAGLFRALAIHMGAWFVGALEIHFALQFLGDPRSFATAIAIESLGHAVKAAGFLVPGAWGVQEGGFIALCAAFGIGSPNAIALSLIKRVPDLLCGAPGLLLWRRMEQTKLTALFLRRTSIREASDRA